MMTYTYPDKRDITRILRVVIIACALITLLFMQAAVLKHAFEHLATSSNRISSLAMHTASQSEELRSNAVDTSRSDLPQGVTCQKCLEDVAHAFIMPSIVDISHAVLAHEMVRAALPHNLPFLSPERANQRAPPSIV